jgi:hypothetical protein
MHLHDHAHAITKFCESRAWERGRLQEGIVLALEVSLLMLSLLQGSPDVNSTLCVDPMILPPPPESPPPLPPDYPPPPVTPDSNNGLGPSPIAIQDHDLQDDLQDTLVTPVNFTSSTPLNRGERDLGGWRMDSFDSDEGSLV